MTWTYLLLLSLSTTLLLGVGLITQALCRPNSSVHAEALRPFCRFFFVFGCAVSTTFIGDILTLAFPIQWWPILLGRILVFRLLAILAVWQLVWALRRRV